MLEHELIFPNATCNVSGMSDPDVRVEEEVGVSPTTAGWILYVGLWDFIGDDLSSKLVSRNIIDHRISTP